MKAYLCILGAGFAASQTGSYDVANAGFTGYTFKRVNCLCTQQPRFLPPTSLFQIFLRSGGGTINPTLYLQKGKTYTFVVNAPGHPFRIISDTTASLPVSYNTFSECTNCVSDEDATSGTVSFAVPANPTSTSVGYRCVFHPQSTLWASSSDSGDPNTLRLMCHLLPLQ